MSTTPITIEGKTVLVTGANRGLGKALVEEALKRGARRVYAASRRPLVHADECVTPVILDVTDPVQIQRAAESVDSLDILINNAGAAWMASGACTRGSTARRAGATRPASGGAATTNTRASEAWRGL